MDRFSDADAAGGQWQFQNGDEVLDASGDKVGKVIGVYPRYLVVEKGWFFPHDYYIPTSAIRQATDGQVFLNLSKDEALAQRWEERPADLEGAATTTTGDAAWSDDLGTPATGTGATSGTTSAAGVTTQTEGEALRVPVHEEELTATKRPVERGQVEVSKDVTSEQQALDVPVTEERVHVEQRVVDREAAPDADVFEEGTIAVPVRGEDVEVQKQVRQTGEVEINKEPVQRTERVADTVRKEQVHVDQTGDLATEDLDDDLTADEVADTTRDRGTTETRRRRSR